MTRDEYLAQVVRLFTSAPDSPGKPSRRDWAIAGDLYHREIPLEHLEHAIRLATLRRWLNCHREPLEPVRSLAYYRAVLLSLPEEAFEPGYVQHVTDAYRRLVPKPRLHSRNTALSRNR